MVSKILTERTSRHLAHRASRRRAAVDVDYLLRSPQRSHADARLRADAGCCDGGVREEGVRAALMSVDVLQSADHDRDEL